MSAPAALTMFVVLSVLPTTYAIGGETVCGVQFTNDAHTFSDSSGREILAVDSTGNVYVGALSVLTSAVPPPDATAGLAVKSGASAKWFFNYTNAYVAGAVLQRAQAMPAAQGGDTAFKSAAGALLALLQGSSGNITAAGYVVADGGRANCPANEAFCKSGNIFLRQWLCSVTETSKGTCNPQEALKQTCLVTCTDHDKGSGTLPGFIYLTKLCTSETACPTEQVNDSCMGKVLLNRTCDANGNGAYTQYDCSRDDGCQGDLQVSYSCSDGACAVQSSVDCSKQGGITGTCKCYCGSHNITESLANGNTCADRIDNDCNGLADDQDPGCCPTDNACTQEGATDCNGAMMRTCQKMPNRPCLQWSGWHDCSKECAVGYCQCGGYGVAESPATNCDDGKDNDCNGAADYDGGGITAKGDSGCPVSMSTIAVAGSNACPKENSNIEIQCTPSVAKEQCVNASIGGTACTSKGLSGDSVLFNCAVGTSNTQTCGSGVNYYTAACSIDTSKCAKSGDDQTAKIYSMPGACDQYSQQTCAAGGCEWCPRCANNKWSGRGGDICVDRGTCTMSCATNQCGAVCQGTDTNYQCSVDTSIKYKCNTATCAFVQDSTEDCNGRETGTECSDVCDPSRGNIYKRCNDWTCVLPAGQCGKPGNTVYKDLVQTCPDTCSETDGGNNKYVAGTTIDKDPCRSDWPCVTATRPDSCVNASTVREWYCVDNKNADYKDIDCGQGYVCKDDGQGGYCYHCDSDGDGYCPAPYGNDCNDNNANIHPGATEICNGIDDDCDGATDEENAQGCITYYYDGDGDTYGTTSSKCLCAASGMYRTTRAGDCDDSRTDVCPSATTCPEKCDNVDHDCDGNKYNGFTQDNCQAYCESAGHVWGASATGSYTKCCGNDGVFDTWCSGSSSCVSGSWHANHCGDGVCNCDESCSSCSQDCGSCCSCTITCRGSDPCNCPPRGAHYQTCTKTCNPAGCPCDSVQGCEPGSECIWATKCS